MLVRTAIRSGKSGFALASTAIAPSTATAATAAAGFAVAILPRDASGAAPRLAVARSFGGFTAIAFMRDGVLGNGLVAEAAFARFAPAFARLATAFTRFATAFAWFATAFTSSASATAPPSAALRIVWTSLRVDGRTVRRMLQRFAFALGFLGRRFLFGKLVGLVLVLVFLLDHG